MIIKIRIKNIKLLGILILILIISIMFNNVNYKRNSLYIYKYIINPIQIEEGLFIFSSFEEKNIIRFIAFNEKINIIPPYLYCIFDGKNKSRSAVIAINYRAVHEKYYNLICEIPKNKKNVNNVIASKTKLFPFNNHVSKTHHNLLFCLTMMFSYNDTYRFIEFVEYYRHFGVDKFIVYNTNCSKQIEQIYRYYINIGLMDVIYDNFTHNLYERKKFHVWKQNDCFFRYKNNYQRIIYTDHDEIIYSPKYINSNDLFANLKHEAASYHFYPKLIITNGNGFFTNGYYSICPYDTWKFVINKSNCIIQVVVHDVLIRNNNKCRKETIDLKNGYVIHARNNPSRHSKLCKNWTYHHYYHYQRSILVNHTLQIYNNIFDKKL